MINNRKSPIRDEYIEKYFAEKELNLKATLKATLDYKEAFKEMILNNENGYLINNGDIKLLAKKMLDFTTNKERAYRMFKSSIIKVQGFSIEKIRNEWQGFWGKGYYAIKNKKRNAV